MAFPAFPNTFRQRIALALLLAGVFFLLLSRSFPGTLATLEEIATDAAWRLLADTRAERRVVVVDIDEASLAQFGPWPWPRERMAKLSDRLHEEGAALQIYDIFFAASQQGDEQLAATLARNQGVIAQVFAIHGSDVRQGQLAATLSWPDCPPAFSHTDNYLGNAPAFSQLPVGHITPQLLRDGNVRAQPGLICHAERAYPALFLAAGLTGSSTKTLELRPGNGLLSPAWELHGLPFTRNGVPLDQHGEVRIPWRIHPDALLSLSARDLLAGKVPTGLLDNAWVLVGSTALGINDRIATPFSNLGAGLTIHAQLLAGMLDDALPVTPRLGVLFSSLGAIAGILLLCLIVRHEHHRVYRLLGGTLLVLLTLFVGKVALLAGNSLWLAGLPPALFIVLFSLMLAVLEYAWSRRERDRLYTHLASYLPSPVAAALAVRAPSGAIDATRSEIIALYADIRNFSRYSENRPPEESAAVLHTFFSVASDIVDQHGGIIESIQGDAILAVWRTGNGDPASRQAQAEAALAAGIALLRQAPAFLPALDDPQLPGLMLGIGIESGTATVGSFGPARRRTHLALGLPVTLALRLEKMTVELAHPLLVGEKMATCLGNPATLLSQGTFLLDGVVTPCRIYACPLPHCVV